MTPKRILYAILFLVTVVAFNNCSNNFSLIESVETLSSLCRSKLVAKAEATMAIDPVLCESPANYQCDVRHFRKGVGTATSQANQCANIAGIGEACVSVAVYNYDTTGQQQEAEPSQLVEGGSYNRDEVSCINTKITTRNIAMIQAEGSTFADTLEKTIESCRQRSRQ
jgi:hypothetical protein